MPTASDAVMTHTDAVRRLKSAIPYLERQRIFTYTRYHHSTGTFSSEIYELHKVLWHTRSTRAGDPLIDPHDPQAVADVRILPRDAFVMPVIHARHLETKQTDQFIMSMDGEFRMWHSTIPEGWMPCCITLPADHKCDNACDDFNQCITQERAHDLLNIYNVYRERKSHIEFPPHLEPLAASTTTSSTTTTRRASDSTSTTPHSSRRFKSVTPIA